MAGDLNARHICWGDRVTTRKGTLLKKWADTDAIRFRANVIPTVSPSFPSANSFLDYCVIDDRMNIPDLINDKIATKEYNSYHKALIFTLNPNSHITTVNPALKYRHMFKKTIWGKFKNHLDNTYNSNVPYDSNLTNDEIDTYIGDIDDKILIAIEKVVPKYRPQDNTLNYTTSKIKKLHKYKSYLITTLNKIHRKYYLNIPTTLNTALIKSLLKETNSVLNAEYRLAYTKYWDTLIKHIDHTKPDKFFPKINRLFRSKNQLEIKTLSVEADRLPLLNRSEYDLTNIPLQDDKYSVHAPADILNIIGAYFETINAPRFINNLTRIKQLVDETAHALINTFHHNEANNITITTFTPTNPAHAPLSIDNSVIFLNTGQVENIIKKLPNKCSSGLNNIPLLVLKHLPQKIVTDYTVLFNNYLNNKYFPAPWKQAKILRILKKNKPPTDPASYRRISLTPAIIKVFEAVINRTLKFYPPLNRPAIHKILNDINHHLHEGKAVGACLIDIEKAFDSVWINGLLYTLNKHNFSLDFIQLIWNSTTNRKFHTWNGYSLSSISFNIVEGLMQGTVNSPELFNIFTYNIPNLFNLNTGNNTYSASFADDFIILVADKYPVTVQSKLDTLLNQINTHYKQWNLKINPSKCESILFHKPLRLLNCNICTQIKNFQLQIREPGLTHIIEHKKIVRYLGVQLDYLLRLTAHINTQLLKAKNSFRGYSNIFSKKALSPRIKLICDMLLI